MVSLLHERCGGNTDKKANQIAELEGEAPSLDRAERLQLQNGCVLIPLGIELGGEASQTHQGEGGRSHTDSTALLFAEHRGLFGSRIICHRL